jgi:O-antigen ligase
LPPFPVTLTFLLRAWRAALSVCFAVLCVPLLIAACHETGTNVWPTLVLIAGSMTLGAWRPFPALFAFTIGVPLLSGLSATSLLAAPAPLELVFSSVWLGMAAKRVLRKKRGRDGERERESKLRKDEGVARTGGNEAGEAAAPRSSSFLPSSARSPLPSLHFPSVAVDLLITAVLASLTWQIWRHHDDTEFWVVLRSRAVLGFGDPHYFLSSALIWLQGMFYFKALMRDRERVGESDRQQTEREQEQVAESGEPCMGFASRLGRKPGAEGNGPRADGMTILSWVRPMFAVLAATMGVFVFIEYQFHIPEGWTWAGFQSPYEDISSFGSLGVAALIFATAVSRITTWPGLVLNVLWIATALGLVAVSWSRATWLAGMVFLLLVAWFRLPRWCTIAPALAAIAVVSFLNYKANQPYWTYPPYLARLVQLVRFEKLENKDPARVELWAKAVGMIRERPVFGHGIGGFYLTSREFARPGDPYAQKPDFAHNVFLQIAAEEGVPMALLFAGMVGLALWRGWAAYRLCHAAGEIRDGLTILGTTLALAAYLQTQMTANSLNVYVSNQFFFWFLMAVLFQPSLGKQEAEA